MNKNLLIGVLCCVVVGLGVFVLTKKSNSDNSQANSMAKLGVTSQESVTKTPEQGVAVVPPAKTPEPGVAIVPPATEKLTSETKTTSAKSQTDALNTFYQFLERYMMVIRNKSSLDKDAKPLDDVGRTALTDWFKNVSFEQMNDEQKVDCERLRKNLIFYLNISHIQSFAVGAKLAELTQMMWPALVDFKLTATKVTNDGHANLADFVDAHYSLAKRVVFNKTDLDKAQGTPAVKLFGEYFVLYVYIGAVDKRYEATPGQATLLGMHPEVLTDPKERELLEEVHNSLLNLSNALNAGGWDTSRAKGRVMVAIIRTMQKLNITPEALGKASDPSYTELAKKMLELGK